MASKWEQIKALVVVDRVYTKPELRRLLKDASCSAWPRRSTTATGSGSMFGPKMVDGEAEVKRVDRVITVKFLGSSTTFQRTADGMVLCPTCGEPYSTEALADDCLKSHIE